MQMNYFCLQNLEDGKVVDQFMIPFYIVSMTLSLDTILLDTF